MLARVPPGASPPFPCTAANILPLALFPLLRPAGPAAAAAMVALVAAGVWAALVSLPARLDLLSLAADTRNTAVMSADQLTLKRCSR